MEASAVTFNRGDTVLVTFGAVKDAQHMHRVRDALTVEFPGVRFVLVDGVSAVAVYPAP